MLTFIPDYWLQLAVDLILITGIISTFLSFFVINKIIRFFPPLANFHPLIQLVSVILLVAGVYFKGSYQTEHEWREKLNSWKTKADELQSKVDQAAIESNMLNEKLEAERKKKQRIRVEYITRVKTELKEVEVERLINAECKVDPKATEILNNAARIPNQDNK